MSEELWLALTGSVEPVGAHNSVVGADQGFRAPSWDQESVRPEFGGCFVFWLVSGGAAVRCFHYIGGWGAWWGGSGDGGFVPGAGVGSDGGEGLGLEGVGAENCVVAGQAAFRYSLMSPPQRAVLATWRCSTPSATPSPQPNSHPATDTSRLKSTPLRGPPPRRYACASRTSQPPGASPTSVLSALATLAGLVRSSETLATSRYTKTPPTSCSSDRPGSSASSMLAVALRTPSRRSRPTRLLQHRRRPRGAMPQSRHTKAAGPPTMRFFAGPAVLIIDELGYLPHDPQFRRQRPVSSRCVSSGSHMFVFSSHTNRGASALGRHLRQTLTIAAAMLDRLLHRCAVINITGDSYRLRALATPGGPTSITGTARIRADDLLHRHPTSASGHTWVPKTVSWLKGRRCISVLVDESTGSGPFLRLGGCSDPQRDTIATSRTHTRQPGTEAQVDVHRGPPPRRCDAEANCRELPCPLAPHRLRSFERPTLVAGPRAHPRRLATSVGRYTQDATNILFIGPPGVGRRPCSPSPSDTKPSKQAAYASTTAPPQTSNGEPMRGQSRRIEGRWAEHGQFEILRRFPAVLIIDELGYLKPCPQKTPTLVFECGPSHLPALRCEIQHHPHNQPRRQRLGRHLRRHHHRRRHARPAPSPLRRHQHHRRQLPPPSPVGAHNSVVGADQGFRAPSWDQESVRDSGHEDSASAPIAAGQRPRPSFRHPCVS